MSNYNIAKVVNAFPYKCRAHCVQVVLGLLPVKCFSALTRCLESVSHTLIYLGQLPQSDFSILGTACLPSSSTQRIRCMCQTCPPHFMYLGLTARPTTQFFLHPFNSFLTRCKTFSWAVFKWDVAAISHTVKRVCQQCCSEWTLGSDVQQSRQQTGVSWVMLLQDCQYSGI